MFCVGAPSVAVATGADGVALCAVPGRSAFPTPGHQAVQMGHRPGPDFLPPPAFHLCSGGLCRVLPIAAGHGGRSLSGHLGRSGAVRPVGWPPTSGSVAGLGWPSICRDC